MKLKELRDKLNSLTDEQLDGPCVIFRNEEEQGEEIDSWEEMPEDIYWMDGDFYGDLEQVKETIERDNSQHPGDPDPLKVEYFVCVKKGTFHLFINSPTLTP